MIGFIPLLLFGGEFWQPLAIAIAGGILGATFIALYFVPPAYYLLKSQSKRDKSIVKMNIKCLLR
jgi:multidrug efflux pump subunit AcrB